VGIKVPFYTFVFFDIGKRLHFLFIVIHQNIRIPTSMDKCVCYIRKIHVYDICITIIFQERKTKIQGLNHLNQNKYNPMSPLSIF